MVSKPSNHGITLSEVAGIHPRGIPTGSVMSATATSTTCTIDCRFTSRNRELKCAYRYPSNSIAWKYIRHVFQTAGEPPRRGRTSFAKRGSTQNRRREEERAEREKRASREQPCREGAKARRKLLRTAQGDHETL